MKPSNILLPAEPGRPAVLLDWAGASAPANASAAGTPATDLAALAVTLGEVLAAGAPVPAPLAAIRARARTAADLATDLCTFLGEPSRARRPHPDRDADTHA